MIHRTRVKQGLTGMEHAPQVELLPNANLSFAPGGYHLMLLNPKRALRAGDRVDITLEFRGGLVISLAYEVRKLNPASLFRLRHHIVDGGPDLRVPQPRGPAFWRHR